MFEFIFLFFLSIFVVIGYVEITYLKEIIKSIGGETIERTAKLEEKIQSLEQHLKIKYISVNEIAPHYVMKKKKGKKEKVRKRQRERKEGKGKDNKL